jgi:hypothetical protein
MDIEIVADKEYKNAQNCLNLIYRQMADDMVSSKEWEKDLFAYGICVKVVYSRAWYNPMRWFKGKINQKRINPKDFYI